MKKILKILMVEDLPSDAELVKREILKSGIQFNEQIVETKEEYIRALQDFNPDIILSDYSLPLFNGMQALLLREELAPSIPFILVTGSMNEETAVEVMKAGADDYVIKEHITRIGIAIKTVLEKAENIRLKKKAEEKLAWEQYLMVTLIDNIPDFIYFKDLESRFLRINKSLAHDFGLNDPLMAIGKSDFDFFKTEHSQEAYHDEQEIIRTGLPIIDKHEIETWFDRPPSWVSTTKMPLKDPNGTIIGTFGISRNITEKKKMLDDLILAKEKAEENDQLKTAFLQNISHEIRTPLNAIVGFSSVLGNPDLPTHKRKEFINIINVSNDQLISIITGIIDLATLDSGQEHITEKETNINQLLKNVQKQLLVDKISPEVTLSYHAALSDEMANIYTDPIKLMQILVNLVGNALKFTHQGYIRFGYHLFKDTLQFFVEDSGIGIPKEMHQYVFERFRQVDNTATRKYGGTGLGLALCKGYVELLGGRLLMKSEPGKGSTFSFSLPYKIVKAVSGKTKDTMFSHPSFDGKEILVAEDEDNNFVLIEELLTSMKLKVVKAENGLEAVNICAGHNSPDLVLMDIKMPVMDGMEATKKIRESNPGLPIIALTAYVFETEKERILASGCNACLEKPIRRQVLYETLVKYLAPLE